jgi:hypothetical protein
MNETRANRRRTGRPPEGARQGERVTDYAQVSVRLPDDMRAKLTALAAVTGLSRWRLIMHAIECYIRNLSPAEQRLVSGLSSRLLKNST